MLQPWKPLEDIRRLFGLDSMQYKAGKLVVDLNEGEEYKKERVLRIEFKHMMALRAADESHRNATSQKIISRKHSLYYSDTSEFIDWIVKESSGILESFKLRHYIIATDADAFIDVIIVVDPTGENPKVEWV